MNNNTVIPASSTSMWINTTGLCVSLTLLLIVNVFKPGIFPTTLAIVCLIAYALPIIILEWTFLKTYRNTSTGLDFFNPVNSFSPSRLTVKLLGLYSTFILVGFIYWLFPHYDDPDYFHYFNLLKSLTPLLVILSIPYFVFVDRYMHKPQDGYWHMGQFCLLNFKIVNNRHLLQHALAWLVKLFFLPLMFTFFYQLVLYFQATPLTAAFINFDQFFDFSFKLLVYTDLLIGTVGYILTLRIFDSQVRTTEPSFLGWFVVLQCYPPFSGFFNTSYLAYSSAHSWTFWLADNSLVYYLWGCAILVLTVIYVWSTLPFGIRFSNLTHRGIITNGPYKFSKHPAYISKNLSWWLISMPFLSTANSTEAIKHSLLLLLVNFVYFLRARTEERHLSWDNDYVAYANYIENKGLFSYTGRKLPFLKFKQHRLFNLP